MRNTKYITSYKHSPYSKISKARILKTKFIYRYTKKLISNNKNIKEINNLCDLGCANGELIYYLNKQLNTNFLGVDNEKRFIITAKKLFKKTKNVSFIKKNLFDLNKKFDVITCLGTATTFSYINELLKKIINLLKPKGLAVVDGIFNKYDCDLIIKYKDSSKKELNFWNHNINVHSQKTIKQTLEKIDNIKFFFVEKKIDVPIKKNKKKPHSHWWTETLNKNYYLTSGLLLKKNPTFLVIKKK
tara:strand:+ start:720 stop:1451 length:732 start_codon:yes stop_codon:yes gene_type:complete